MKFILAQRYEENIFYYAGSNDVTGEELWVLEKHTAKPYHCPNLNDLPRFVSDKLKSRGQITFVEYEDSKNYQENQYQIVYSPGIHGGNLFRLEWDWNGGSLHMKWVPCSEKYTGGYHCHACSLVIESIREELRKYDLLNPYPNSNYFIEEI